MDISNGYLLNIIVSGKNKKLLKNLSTKDWLNKLCYIQTDKYSTVIEKIY